MGLTAIIFMWSYKYLQVIVAMKHTTKAGAAKILNKCTLPLTGEKVVDLIITDLGVFEVNIDGLLLTEIAEGVNIEKIRYKTEASFKISPNLKIMSQ
jgi:acetate CoA/acetoacetate CoA-transferase beta subunit